MLILGQFQSDLVRLLTLRDYNTRVVMFGTLVLGLAAGVVGTFMLLRKRALMGDALSHATLPGIVLTFIVVTLMGGDGKNLAVLLTGATIFGLLGVACVMLIRNVTRLKEDAALGIVLSVFFGFGVALLGIAQEMPQGGQAGLNSFITGKPASLTGRDMWGIIVVAVILLVVSAALYKEFKLLSFDQNYAAARGWPVLALDITLMALVTAVTVIGLHAVGLILVIALLIIPPAAARFWTDRLGVMLPLAGAIGAVSAVLGAALSALVSKLAAGAVIVLVAASLFAISMIFGPRRGVLARYIQHVTLTRRVNQQNLLRAMYEGTERGGDEGVTLKPLLEARSWSRWRLRRTLAAAQRQDWVRRDTAGRYHLTDRGQAEAAQVLRNHRLWELYLITHADVAPSHVDRDADMIEHVLGGEMVRKLEAILERNDRTEAVPRSPHVV